MRSRHTRRRFATALETLETRALFASLTGVEIGAACAPYVSGETASGAAAQSSSTFSTSSAKKASTRTEYEYSFAGNAGNATVAPTQGGLALMGGGAAVDEAFQWLAQRANGGDFVVLTVDSTKYYNRYVSDRATLDSVETLVIPTRAAADDEFVLNKIANAEAIFINGGDQADYINLWSGTDLEDALYAALGRSVPIGGTSAGLAVLGDIDFTAVNGSITSAEALDNPEDPRITLDDNFLSTADPGSAGTVLNLLNNVIADTHFMQRDRMGRLMTFMARMEADGLVPSPARGIAVNEQTALLVEASGMASVVGNPDAKKSSTSAQQRSVYFLQGTTPDLDAVSTPLNYSVDVQRAGIGDSFDLAAWEGTGVDEYDITASGGVLSSDSDSIYG